jgi:hypothetical protein
MLSGDIGWFNNEHINSTSMISSSVGPDAARISFREIGETDIAGVLNLLTDGFRRDGRSRDFWVLALTRLSEHPTPEGFPKYGYLLEYKNSMVGVILLIFSSIPVDGGKAVRCSVSSWCVEPSFRCYAPILVSLALKRKDVTYFNITPRQHTHEILEAQGYIRYSAGRFLCIPTLSVFPHSCRVQAVYPDIRSGDDLSSFEVELLLVHASYGCISLICRTASGSYPFVFMPRKKCGLPYAYLAYCRDLKQFIRCAAPLGRFLLARGFPLVVLDSNGPILGLVGRYWDGFPKYFKGPVQPRLGDYLYSERVMFGI